MDFGFWRKSLLLLIHTTAMLPIKALFVSFIFIAQRRVLLKNCGVRLTASNVCWYDLEFDNTTYPRSAVAVNTKQRGTPIVIQDIQDALHSRAYKVARAPFSLQIFKSTKTNNEGVEHEDELSPTDEWEPDMGGHDQRMPLHVKITLAGQPFVTVPNQCDKLAKNVAPIFGILANSLQSGSLPQKKDGWDPSVKLLNIVKQLVRQMENLMNIVERLVLDMENLETRLSDLKQEYVPVDDAYWSDLLLKACSMLEVVAKEDLVLGEGVDVRVLKVYQVDDHEKEKPMALKLVSERAGEFLCQQQFTMQMAFRKCPQHVMEVYGFTWVILDHRPDAAQTSGLRMGAAMLLSRVGKKVPSVENPITLAMAKNIVKSLGSLHMQGIVHGNACLENVLEVDGSYLWIDFCGWELEGSDLDKMRRDMLMLTTCIFQLFDLPCTSSLQVTVKHFYDGKKAGLNHVLEAVSLEIRDKAKGFPTF